jgi:hypothetical protein
MCAEIDRAYFSMRAGAERQRAAEADEPVVKSRHEALARAYELKVEALSRDFQSA